MRTLADAADILLDYGYAEESAVIGRIAENEQTRFYNRDQRTDWWERILLMQFSVLVETARGLAAENRRHDYCAALIDLLARFEPKDRDRLWDYACG